MKPEFHEWGYVFCRYQYFCYEILFYLVSSCSPFFESLKSKSTQNLRPQKGNSGVSYNDTLLNFGLWAENFRMADIEIIAHGPLFLLISRLI